MAYSQILAPEVASEAPGTTVWGNKVRENFDFLKAKTDGIPAAAFSGLKPAPGVDTNHDVTVATGAARDITDVSTLVLAAAQVKQLDARWVTGTNAGGLANAALIAANITVSFDNATSKILGVGLFGGAAAGDTIIVVGSAANSGIHEVTAATANDATLSVAPTTEAAGPAITVYIVKANWLYNIFIADNGAAGVEIGFDDSLTAANFLSIAGVGTLYRCIGYVDTGATANISEITWIGDGARTRVYVPGSYTWRKNAMLNYVKDLEVQAGGGSTGGTGITGPYTSSGAAGGGYSRKYRLDNSALGTTETVTVGAIASTSSFGAHVSATGGATVAQNGVTAQPGGVATGGDINIDGQAGERGNTGNILKTAGGDSFLGHGGAAPLDTAISNDSNPASGYGAGASGSSVTGTSDANGAVGTAGILMLAEVFA